MIKYMLITHMLAVLSISAAELKEEVQPTMPSRLHLNAAIDEDQKDVQELLKSYKDGTTLEVTTKLALKYRSNCFNKLKKKKVPIDEAEARAVYFSNIKLKGIIATAAAFKDYEME